MSEKALINFLVFNTGGVSILRSSSLSVSRLQISPNIFLFPFSRVQLLSGLVKGDYPWEVRMVPGGGSGTVQDDP
jgi:hypothetical protein